VEFVRSPFGLYDTASNNTYGTMLLPLVHAYWDGQATILPTGDLGPGIPMGTAQAPSDMLVRLRAIAAEARIEMRRRIQENEKNKVPPPEPRSIVIRLHDVSAVTAAHLQDIISVIRNSEAGNRKPTVPIRFCSTLEEVEAALRTVKPLDLTRPNFGLPDLAREPYDLRPRFARIYGDSEEDTLQIWDLIFTEGWVHHLYLDHLGKLTAGIGSLIDAKKLEKLPLKKGNQAASEDEKKAARDELLKQQSKLPKKLKPRLRKCHDITGLHLEDTDTLAFMQADRKLHVGELEGLVLRMTSRPLAAQPPPVRIALADMMFNLGQTKLAKFSKLFAAIRKSDWKAAEGSCRRNSRDETKPGQEGIKKRNDATAALFRAVARLEVEQPLALAAALVTKITHAADGKPALQPLAVKFTLEKGWELDGELKWTVRIISEAVGRNDESQQMNGTASTLTFSVGFGNVLRAGRIQLTATARVKRKGTAPIQVDAQPSGVVEVLNPTAAAVRASLEASSQVPPLPAITLKAIAYDATTLGSVKPEASAFLPFSGLGLPIEPAKLPSGQRSGFYGLMRLPAASAHSDDLWNWTRQLTAAQMRLTVAVTRANDDSAGLPTEQALSEQQLQQQAIHYYGQLDATLESASLTQYWRRDTAGKDWIQIEAGLRKYTDRVVAIIAAVAAGNPPKGWNA
jgi:GH24 family phage-related lysozyme (muramidase)